MNSMRILAIETSCDETAAAIVEIRNFQPVVLSTIVASQFKAHAETGGVVPDVAARLHAEALPEVLDVATNRQKLGYDAVAVTVGPGLISCLLLGLSAAKTLAAADKLPFFPINHLEGHIYSAWLNNDRSDSRSLTASLQSPAASLAGDSGMKLSWQRTIRANVAVGVKQTPVLPALFVIVSGGHTELVLMTQHLRYKVLGTTRDDAAGEAFDKVARLLGLPYPGGPAVSELAKHGDKNSYQFPISLTDNDSFEFSFSGLKAAIYHLIKELPQPLSQHTKADIAASFEHTVALTISRKVVLSLKMYPEIQGVSLVGGVAANKYMRVHLEQEVKKIRPRCQFIVPPFEYCTDNAAMIGAAAAFRHLFGKSDDWRTVEADPNLTL